MADANMRILVVEARFYAEISDELATGAIAVLERAGCDYDRVVVPGALEIPTAIAMAEMGDEPYDGYVALGCVIRGETSHYDIVAGESARALMDLATGLGLAIGNGIITTENDKQAMARARAGEKDKGGFAAQACLDMIALRDRFAAAGDEENQ